MNMCIRMPDGSLQYLSQDNAVSLEAYLKGRLPEVKGRDREALEREIKNLQRNIYPETAYDNWEKQAGSIQKSRSHLEAGSA